MIEQLDEIVEALRLAIAEKRHFVVFVESRIGEVLAIYTCKDQIAAALLLERFALQQTVADQSGSAASTTAA